jgi:transmembrane 9 superfamily protein 2/4
MLHVLLRGGDGGVWQGFYLPGVAPRAFKDGEAVQMKVQTLVSTETPLQFDYYQLPFCEPRKIHDLPENLGEALAGEKAHTSAFKARVKVNEYCKVLCRKNYTPQQMEEFQDFAILEYRVNMRLDNLPVAEMINFAFEDKPDKTMQIYNLGYALGGKLTPDEKAAGGKTDSDTYVLNNHLRFKIKYHPVDTDGVMTEGSPDGSYIVGFEVMPFSIKHSYYGKWNASAVPYHRLTTCVGDPPNGRFERHQPQVIDPTEGGQVIFTYDIEWEQSSVKWASRWDVYLQLTDDNIHWFSIVNSFVILIFLTGIVALIMLRILRKDFARYNELALTEEELAEANREMREETGWKLVYGDVFRAPPLGRVLAVYAGSGFQLFVMTILTLMFAMLGFLSPANRGALLSSVLVFFVLMGLPAGYMSARFAKLLKQENQFQTALLTGTLFPGVCFAIFFFVNTIAWSKQSSTAVPFGTLVVLALLWFGVSLPLVFFGSFLGSKKDPLTVPVQTNPIPRQIPPQLWYLQLPTSVLMGGLLSFGAVFVEMFFIISSIWQHRFYYMFGFLALVFVILVVTCAEITIVLCYLHLCAEEYRWWWRSFLTSGAVAGYMWFYGGYHYFTRAHPAAHYDALASSVYFGYLTIFCYAVWVLTGFIGFFATFQFVVKIYGSIKID